MDWCPVQGEMTLINLAVSTKTQTSDKHSPCAPLWLWESLCENFKKCMFDWRFWSPIQWFLYKFEFKIKSVKKKFYYVTTIKFFQWKLLSRFSYILWCCISIFPETYWSHLYFVVWHFCSESCLPECWHMYNILYFHEYKVFINEIIARSTCNLLVLKALEHFAWKLPYIIVLQFELKFFIFFLPILLLCTHNNAKPRHLKVPLKFAH